MPVSARALVALVASAAISAAAAARPRDHDYGPDYVDYEPRVEDKSNARESRAARGGARSSPLGDDRNARAPSSAPGAFAPSTAPSPGPSSDDASAFAPDPAPAPTPAPVDEASLRAFEAERARVASAPVVRRYAAATMRSMDDSEYRPGDWLLGRATYFDAPASWKRAFAPHAFGDLHGNGCGFVNKHEGLESNADFPFPLDAVAAVADFDSRLFEGACGSCFEIRCVTGPVLWSYDQDDRVRYTDPPGFFERAPNATDTTGRAVPKRNAESFDGVEAEYARCWNTSRSLFVTIVDKCPCEYFYEQRVCCGPMPHFDLSYYAHEKLAHPIQGKIMIQFRPVACGSRAPVDARLGAAARMETRAVGSEDGVLSRADRSGQRVARVGGSRKDGSRKDERRRPVVVFENGPAPGWLLSAYGDRFLTVFARGRGVGGGNATCVTVRPGGRLLARCERCEDRLKPFAGNDGRVVTFWINVTKPHARDSRIEASSAPPPQPCVDMTLSLSPPLYLGVSKTGAFDFRVGAAPEELACGTKTRFFYCAGRVVVPLAALPCGGAAAEDANSVYVELGRGAEGEHEICLDDMRIESIG